MRVKLTILAMLLALAIPAFAQEVPQGGGVCCKAPGGETTHYPMLGVCPAGTVKVSLAECGIAEPTPVPTPIPEFVPKDIKVPARAETVTAFLISKFGKTIVVPGGAAIGVILVWLTGLLRQAIPKLKGATAFLATSALALIGTLISVLADGQIAPDEIMLLLVAVLGVLAAIPGYRFVWSTKAQARIGK